MTKTRKQFWFWREADRSPSRPPHTSPYLRSQTHPVLEPELGTPLYFRDLRGMSLTEAGTMFQKRTLRCHPTAKEKPFNQTRLSACPPSPDSPRWGTRIAIDVSNIFG